MILNAGSNFFQLLYTLPVRLDTLKTTNSRSLQSPQAADRRLENTTSPQTQKCDIQEINEENRQTQKIYHFQNCGTVNLNVDSFNTRTITMENCGNKVPQVTLCSSFFLPLTFCHHVMSYYQIKGLMALRRAIKIYLCNPMPSFLMVCRYLLLHAISY